LRILWHSNAPWAATGYGNQTRLFTNRIRDLGHDVTMSAFYGLEGGILDWNGMRILPRGGEPYGGDILPKHYEAINADLAITLIDAWVYHPEQWPPAMRWVPWFPVDSEPAAPPVIRAVTQAYQRIVYSKFAVKMMNDAGIDVHYVPHGVDTKVYRPLPQAASRDAVHFPQDKFIVGIVGANKGSPPRKAWPEMLTAFAEFHRKHNDTVLYLHTNPTQSNGGVNLFEFIEQVGLKAGTDVLISDPYMATMIGGVGDGQMVTLYSALDVHLLASSGEGFGIPIVEAQACGCPVIVGDWTSMPELCFSGWKIPKSEAHPFYLPLGTYQFYPRVGAIVDALEAAYRMKGNEDYRKRARDGALAYDADKVAEKYWKPVLEKIAAKIEGTHTAPAPAHTHKWLQTGLFNPDGSISMPCVQCGAELIEHRSGNQKVVEGGFANKTGLTFSEPDGIEWIILREIERDYHLDNLEFDENSRVLDIGAHVGIVSMYLAKTYGCKVQAYEPNPHNYKRLVANLKANGLDRLVTAHNLAVTGDGRDVVISEANPGGNSGGHTIYGTNGVTVGSTTLKAMLDGAPVDLLKIDCEGAEFEILADVESLKQVKAIRGEFHAVNGDVDALAQAVKAIVPDTLVSFQGWAR
jgi:FkbM family methyltransferase